MMYFSVCTSHHYGTPNDLRLIDQAHQCGIGVILDVVYKHLGSGLTSFQNSVPIIF
jgi:1,4-alpha-glucan branching enzyme